MIYKIHLNNGVVYPINEDHGYSVVTTNQGVVVYKVTQVVDMATKESNPVGSPIFMFPYTSILLMDISEPKNPVVAQPTVVDVPSADVPVVTPPETTQPTVN